MRLHIREIHAPPTATALNQEWFVVENSGDRPFSTAGCTVSIGAAGRGTTRLRGVGTLDPGFTLQPGERVRVITGNPAKKAHGEVLDGGGARSYHLFLAEPLFFRFAGAGGASASLAITLKQHEIARAVYDPSAAGGVAAEGGR
jgi:hypothetical protein